MHAPISELDEVMAICTKIWFQWDEESDKIQAMFREIAKRQRSDVKFQHRNQYRHKELENRLNELTTFRYFDISFENFLVFKTTARTIKQCNFSCFTF